MYHYCILPCHGQLEPDGSQGMNVPVRTIILIYLLVSRWRVYHLLVAHRRPDGTFQRLSRSIFEDPAESFSHVHRLILHATVARILYKYTATESMSLCFLLCQKQAAVKSSRKYLSVSNPSRSYPKSSSSPIPRQSRRIVILPLFRIAKAVLVIVSHRKDDTNFYRESTVNR